MMRTKMKAVLAAVTFALLLALSPTQSVLAAPAAPEGRPTTEQASSRDAVEVEPTCSGCGTGTYISKVSTSRVNARHAQYLTGSWAKADKYTWTTTVTTTATLSSSVGVSAKTVSGQIGATYSTAKGFSVATSIPASPSRYSKLALRADYNKHYVRVTKKAHSVTISTKYTYLYSPIKGTQTLYVRYK